MINSKTIHKNSLIKNKNINMNTVTIKIENH